jgi:hypothetical protein
MTRSSHIAAQFAPTLSTDDAAKSPTAGLTSFALVGQGPPVPAAEVERSEKDSLEVRVLWDSNVLATHFLEQTGSIVIGDHEESIALIPSAALGSDSFEIATATEDGYMVRVPTGAEARVQSGAAWRRIEGPTSFATSRGDEVTMSLGTFCLQLVHGAAGRQVPAVSFAQRIERSATLQVAGAALLHTALFGIFAYYTPALAGDESSTGREDQIVMMREYLLSSAEREQDRADEHRVDESGPAGGAPSGGARAKGTEGAMGKEGAPVTNLRWGKQGPADNRNPMLDHTRAIDAARNFGIIGMIAQSSGDPSAPIAAWGMADALGADPMSAQGNMWGPSIGESSGVGGLGLTGTGENGGGLGEGVGLNPNQMAGLGHFFGPGGDGPGGGIGSGGTCPGCRLGGHATRGPSVRPNGNTVVNGHIPAEVIQRVVRNNFGRFRNCYMGGLRDNPNLEGRVVTRFTVDRQGMVSSAQDGGSTLPNSGVVSCVIKAFYGLSFPEHDGGIVTVVYPLALQPE